MGKGLVGFMLDHRQIVAVVLLFALMPMVLGGCYGRFPLTGKIYDWNGKVSDNKWVKTLVMWVCLIIPVYGVCMFVDAIVFNLVEFWGGAPLMASVTDVDRDGNTVTLAPGATADEAILTVSRDGRTLAQERFVRVSADILEARGADGELHGTMLRAADGSISLTDRDGVVLGRVTPDSLAAIATN